MQFSGDSRNTAIRLLAELIGSSMGNCSNFEFAFPYQKYYNVQHHNKKYIVTLTVVCIHDIVTFAKVRWEVRRGVGVKNDAGPATPAP